MSLTTIQYGLRSITFVVFFFFLSAVGICVCSLPRRFVSTTAPLSASIARDILAGLAGGFAAGAAPYVNATTAMALVSSLGNMTVVEIWSALGSTPAAYTFAIIIASCAAWLGTLTWAYNSGRCLSPSQIYAQAGPARVKSQTFTNSKFAASGGNDTAIAAAVPPTPVEMAANVGETVVTESAATNDVNVGAATDSHTFKLDANQAEATVPVVINTNVDTAPNRKLNDLDIAYGNKMYAGQLQFTTQAPGALVGTLAWSNVVNDNNIKRLFTTYKYARFDLEVTMANVGNVMNTGHMIAAARPAPCQVPSSYPWSVPSSVAYSPVSALDSLVSLDHCLINASKRATYKMTIKYSHFAEWITAYNYTTIPNWGHVIVAAFSSLTAATGACADCRLTCYISLKNIEVNEKMSYLSQTEARPVECEVIVPRRSFLRRSFHRVAQSLFSIFGDKNTSYNISGINDSTLPVNVTGDAMSNDVSAQIMPFDDPAYTANKLNIADYWQKFSFRGMIDAFRFSRDTRNLETVTESALVEMRQVPDEMLVSNLMSRWTLNEQFVVNAATTTGSLQYISPGAPLYTSSAQTAPPLTKTTGPNEVAAFAQYWRGDIEYKIVLSSNTFASAQLICCFFYGIFPTDPTLGNITTGKLDPRSVPHAIIDLGESGEQVFLKVPYKSPYANGLRVNTDFATVPASELNCMGTFCVYLSSPVCTNVAASGSVTVTVLQRSASDMLLLNPVPAGSMYAQADGCLDLSSGSPVVGHRLHQMALLLSLKQLLSVPTFLGSYTMSPDNSTGNYDPVILPIHPAFLRNSPAWSYALSCFAGMKGSLRVVVRHVSTISSTSTAYDSVFVIRSFPRCPFQKRVGTLSQGGYGFYRNTFLADGESDACIGLTRTPQGWYLPVTTLSYVQTASGTPSNYTTGISDFMQCFMDTNRTRERVVEMPSSSYMFTTDPVFMYPMNYTPSITSVPNSQGTVSTPGSYSIESDANLPWICVAPADNVGGGPQYTIQLQVMAGDDFRFFNYCGGP